MGHLVTTAHRVLPRRLPHGHARRERIGDVQAVAGVEAGHQHQATRYDGSQPAPRHRVEREEHARQEQRRAQVLLQEEEGQGQTHAAEYGQHVTEPGHAEP